MAWLRGKGGFRTICSQQEELHLSAEDSPERRNAGKRKIEPADPSRRRETKKKRKGGGASAFQPRRGLGEKERQRGHCRS